ncbi:Uncharacterized protein dnm_075600 [Desulfonema magnum]|uniref:Uncharacterized protein n=1 Tax=Desulfonema magnum TaxID=45655 RepID=A0A975BUD4_9BACT|nr:Uncharacterized protein dnm_075600 [Desulfonema magnum]
MSFMITKSGGYVFDKVMIHCQNIILVIRKYEPFCKDTGWQWRGRRSWIS